MKGEIKPIRTKADHTAALKDIEKLWDAKDGTPEADRLEVLTTLVQSYEDQHYIMDAPDPIVAIEFRLEQQGLDRKALEPLMGSRGRVSEVMSRKRALSIDMIRKLNSELGIPASVLVQASKSAGEKTTSKARHRVATSEAYEVQYWKKKFGITGQGLAGAIRAVGSNNVEKISAYLKTKRK